MANKSLGNPYDGESSLTHSVGCACAICTKGGNHSTAELEKLAENMETPPVGAELQTSGFDSSDDMMDRAIENAIVRGVFGQNERTRRQFINLVGGGTLAAVLGSILPMDKIKAAVKESNGPLEKTKLKVGFVPITCAHRSSWPTHLVSMKNMG